MSTRSKQKISQAIRVLRAAKVDFEEHPYRYEEGGGTAVSARELQVPEHRVIKTLIMEDEKKSPYIVLMHGDREVSLKSAARILSIKSLSPCSPETATRHSGYRLGGTSPFGTKRNMPVIMEESIGLLDRVFINGGRRGLLVSVETKDLMKILQPRIASISR